MRSVVLFGLFSDPREGTGVTQETHIWPGLLTWTEETTTDRQETLESTVGAIDTYRQAGNKA